MAAIKEKTKRLFQRLLGAAREQYDDAATSTRQRALVGLFVFIDVVIVAILFFSLSTRDIEVWYERAFPHDMVMIKNLEPTAIRNAVVTLDGKYSAKVDVIAPGAMGLKLDRDFLDPQSMAPDGSYRPRVLEIATPSERIRLELSERKAEE